MATTKKTATSSKSSKTNAKSETKAEKPASKPKTQKTTTASTTSKSVTSTNNSPAKNIWKIIVGIVLLLAAAVVATFIVVSVIDKNEANELVVKNGNGDKIETSYVDFNNNKYRLKIPTSFKTLDSDKIKEEYGENAPNVIYTDNAADENKANATISVTYSTETFKNDQVEQYLETMKSIFKVGADSIESGYYDVDGHNVGTLKFTVKSNDEGVYNYMMFFSVDDKLNLVTFSCNDKVANEWKPVGDFVIKSLTFNK